MRTFAWIILAGLVGGLLGAALAWVNAAGVLRPWARLPAPPQAAVRLLAAADAYLVVADGSGQLYLYQRVSETWTPIDGHLAAAYPNQALAGPANRFMPAPPEGALGVNYVLDPGQEGGLEYGAYALGQDGSVWAWFQSASPADLRTGLALPAIGAGLGLGAGLLAWLARLSWQRLSKARGD